MSRFKIINFHQNKPKIKFFLQKKIFSSPVGFASSPPMAFSGASRLQKQPLPSLQISGCAPDSKRVQLRCCLYFQVIESYNEKLLR